MDISICPICNCGITEEIPKLGFVCRNCGEIFTKDERDDVRTVDFEEWIDYINRHDLRDVILQEER